MCHRQVAFMIIQDLERTASLIRENKIRNPQTVIVPNSSLGRPQSETSDLFQKRFSISSRRRIVLQQPSSFIV